MKSGSQFFAIGIEEGDYSNSKTTIGFIQIGQFEERFELDLHYWNAKTYLAKWNEALLRMIKQRQPVALLTRMVCPQNRDYLRAWIFYPEDNAVFIRERLFIHPDRDVKFDSEEQIINLQPRQSVNEDGNKISEWETTLDSIKASLKP